MEQLVLDRKAKKICEENSYELYRQKPNEKFKKKDIEDLTESLFFWLKLSVEEPKCDLQKKINRLCHARYVACLKQLKRLNDSPFLDYMLKMEKISDNLIN